MYCAHGVWFPSTSRFLIASNAFAFILAAELWMIFLSREEIGKCHDGSKIALMWKSNQHFMLL